MMTIAIVAAGMLLNAHAPAPDDGLARLTEMMVGSFSSEAQSKLDADFFDIRLRMDKIWSDQPGEGVWLYVEQAIATSLEAPYRQRIYHLTTMNYTSGDGKARSMVVSEVWMLPGDPLKFVGAGVDQSKLKTIKPADLTRKDGCEVILVPAPDGTFAGSTLGRACPSERQGAVYATSMVKVDAEGLTTWDRGYDDNSKQVWGATKAGYEFRRVRAEAPGNK